MTNLTELSYEAADQVEELASGLHKRVQEQIEEFLASQLKKLGVSDKRGFKRVLYPDDPKTLAVYQYDGKDILAVRIGPNDMSIVFDVPEIETQKEVRDCD